MLGFLSNGIFESHAQTYLDQGYSIIPVNPNDKKPSIRQWQIYSQQMPTQKELDHWINLYPDHSIGLVCGPASGVCAFDYDYDYDEARVSVSKAAFKSDKAKVEINALSILPPSPLGKKGNKGWTRVYRVKDDGKIKNLSINRRGVRCFDFMYEGRQIVVPPSVHPETKNPYKWLTDGIEDIAVSDLPILDYQIIVELSELLRESMVGKKSDGGRHWEIFTYATEICSLVDTQTELAEKMVKFDHEKNGKNAYLTDPKYFKTNDALKNALSWTPRIFHYVENKKKLSSNKQKSSPYRAFELFFDKTLNNPKKCALSGALFFKDKSGEMIQAVEHTKALKSYAKEAGLPKSDVEDHLDRYIFEKKPELLIDVEDWDGVDRIGSLKKYIILKDQDPEIVVEFIKDWGSKVFRRLFDSEEQNRCLIFKGGQGIGKDSLITSLIKGFGMYKTKFAMQANERDYLNTYSKKLVVHIEEFDQTNKMGIGFLKSLITRDEAEFRKSYGRDDVIKQMHCSFISSVNFDTFLRDPTGNRRFVVFDVERINWGYDRDWGKQIVAQFYQLYKDGYYIDKKHIDYMTEYVKKYEQIEIEDEVLPLWDERVANIQRQKAKYDPGYRLRIHDVDHVMGDLCKSYDMKRRWFLGMLKKTNRSRQDMKSTYYLSKTYNFEG